VFHQTAGFTLGEATTSRKRIGLGLAALGRPGYINLGHADDLHHDYDKAAMEARAHAVLDAAWAGGVRYFDAARSYGAAEQFLASWLNSRRIAPEVVFVASKWGYAYTAGWKVEAEKHEIKDHTLPVLLRQYAESRNLLGDHLDLYQIHSATLESGVLDDRAVLTELVRMRSTTGVKIGLTLSGPRQAETLRRAMEVVIDRQRVFDCVQATWNLLELSAGPALQAAHDAGMGVIVKEALANGRLTARNQDAAFAKKRKQLEAEANRRATTPDALALAAVLAQPWADVVLSGAATVDQLQSNLEAAAVQWDEEAGRRLDALRETSTEYWGKRGVMAWN
jgi:aryl-alcohol dehydrogenase-like predicted oxidoreductase